MTDLRDLPDSTLCYVPGHGETTLGAIRGEEKACSEDDATVRMWVLIALYDPKAKPWKTGRIRVGSKFYPLSVCLSDRFFPLSTSASQFADIDIHARSARSLEELLSTDRRLARVRRR